MKKMTPINKSRKDRVTKTLDFMDFMVRMVFFGTFIFTIAVMYFVWHFGWESTLLSLIDRWFTIMVSELVIMGVIQVSKRVVEAIGAAEEKKVTIVNKEDGEEDIGGY